MGARSLPEFTPTLHILTWFKGTMSPSHWRPEPAMQLFFRYILAVACTAVICNSTILLAPATAGTVAACPAIQTAVLRPS